MNTCYLCDNELTPEIESKEHILLNSIGGRLKSNKLLCKDCNSKFGHSADSELSRQLAFLGSSLQVKRESGSHPIIKGGRTKNGIEYHLKDGGTPMMSKPSFESSTSGDQATYSITARDGNELRNMLKGLKGKYPNLDIEEAMKNAKWNEKYLNEPISYDMTVGGNLAFRSIAKTAINYYIFTQNEKQQVAHNFNLIKEDTEMDIVKHYHPTKKIYKKEKGEIVHLIHLVGNKYKKSLYCYIEFFSCFSFIVNLSNNYSGKSFSSTYCYNVIDSKVVDKNVNLNINSNEINKIPKIRREDFEIIQSKIKRVFGIAEKIQTSREISRIVKKSVDRIFEIYKDEKFITEEMVNELSNDVAHAFVKFSIRRNKLP